MGKKSRAKSKPSRTTNSREERYNKKKEDIGGVEDEEKDETQQMRPQTSLSAELLAELGGVAGEEDTMVVLSNKKKRKSSDEDPLSKVKITQEDIEDHRKLSKRARKRIEQIVARKEREAKRSEYIQKLQEHAISTEHQQLLTSTKLIGQTLTFKQRLRVLHKRYQAGLHLSSEEMDLLFPHGKREAGDNLAQIVDNDRSSIDKKSKDKNKNNMKHNIWKTRNPNNPKVFSKNLMSSVKMVVPH